MALAYSKEMIELREIVLKNKPEAMLEASPKGTVPVLVLPNESSPSKVIDESFDIMIWALNLHDPAQWLPNEIDKRQDQLKLIEFNDSEFKKHLDHYKYADRFPEHSAEFYRSQGEEFLQILEIKLTSHAFLFGPQISLADVAIFPFIRQFAYVDKAWFDQADYPKLQQWLEHFLGSDLFLKIMPKFACWKNDDEPIFLSAVD